MYNYTLKYSLIISLITTIVFFFIRDYGFALFSITGAETSVFYIALFGIFIISAQEITIISNKMLDGIGKSYHSLVLTNGLIIFEIIIIALLSQIFTSGVGVLIGMAISEVVFSIITYSVAKTILNGDNFMEEEIVIMEEKVEIIEEEKKRK